MATLDVQVDQAVVVPTELERLMGSPGRLGSVVGNRSVLRGIRRPGEPGSPG